MALLFVVRMTLGFLGFGFFVALVALLLEE
jgi:hypothetical protein